MLFIEAGPIDRGTLIGLLVDVLADAGSSKPVMVDVLRAYLNRPDLRVDLEASARQLQAALAHPTPDRSVKTIRRAERDGRKLTNRLTDEQVRELVAAYRAGGVTRLQLADRYGIGRSSVAKLLRVWREQHPDARRPEGARY